MLAAETAVWEAWRAHDAKKLADLTARDISFINIFGVYLATKTDAMQDWSGTYCDVESISLTDDRNGKTVRFRLDLISKLAFTSGS